MGVEDTARKGFFSKPPLRSRNTVFTLGQRGALLGSAELEAPIIVPHAAQRSDVRYPFEALFRSQHYALVDNSCREFLFLCDFFAVSGGDAMQLYGAVMGRTLTMFLVGIFGGIWGHFGVFWVLLGSSFGVMTGSTLTMFLVGIWGIWGAF
ncbi:vacuolar protein sorting-associated protein 52 homolog [Phasianus colchicus]|uniref:vacuolar protein sorting-associated protein 52 homolog n=1 Tax=Phasianus colchicus TaxID=9054 RepID=UPI00129D750C|nr:vacuolar protein sorting-associated protein 52 homolog [Phasianus colchicus]